MRFILGAVLLVFASACHAADGTTQATRFLEGTKTTFPARTVKDGVTAAIAAVESCHDSTESSDPAADLKKALAGDHVRLVFAKPVKVEVLDREYQVSEIIFSNGAFWLRIGDKVQRCTKYEYDFMKPFQKWYRQTLPAD